MSNEIKSINNELIDIENIYKDIKEKIIVARGNSVGSADWIKLVSFSEINKSR